MSKYLKLHKRTKILVDDDIYEILKTKKVYRNKQKDGSCYASVCTDQGMMSIQRFIMKPPKGMVVDHINRKKEDCRRKNLRVCTHSVNSRNRAKFEGTSSKYKGVTWNKRTNRWVAVVHGDNKTTYVGVFKDELEAAKAHDRKSLEMYGKTPSLNFKNKFK